MYAFSFSVDNSVHEQQSTDSHDGPVIECHRVLPAPSVPRVILSGKPQLIDQYGYHVIEPNVLNSNGTLQRTEDVHYEQVYTTEYTCSSQLCVYYLSMCIDVNR